MLHLRVIGTIEASEKAGNVIVEGSRHIIPTHPPGNVALWQCGNCGNVAIGNVWHSISLTLLPAPSLPPSARVLPQDQASHFQILGR